MEEKSSARGRADEFGHGPTHDSLSASDRVVRALLIAVFVVVTARLAIPPLIVGLPYGWDAVVYTQAAREWLQGGNPWASGAYAIDLWRPLRAFCRSCRSLRSLTRRFPSFGWASPFFGRLQHPAPRSSRLVAPVSSRFARYHVGLLGAPRNRSAAARHEPGGRAWGLDEDLRGTAPTRIGRWRSLLVASALLLATAPMPWGLYWDERGRVAQLLEGTSDLSAAFTPWLLPPAIVGLVLLGRRRAAWLIVPTLWPNTQLDYSSLHCRLLGRCQFSPCPWPYLFPD